MTGKQRLKIICGALLILIVMAPFQNCAKVSNSSSEPQKPQGNGQGYDGKVFAEVLASGTCADGSNVNTKIAFQSGNGHLLRDACANLPIEAQAIVQVQADAQDPTRIVYNGKALDEVPPQLCTQLPSPVAAQPLIDMQAAAYVPGSPDWINTGSGGSAYNFITNGGDRPTYVANPPEHFLFGNGTYLPLRGNNTSFIDNLHKKGARYTFIFEGLLSAPSRQVLISTGSLENFAGVALFYDPQQLNFHVGNGNTQSFTCVGNNSLCVFGPTLPVGPAVQLFAAVSVDEPGSAVVMRANETSWTTNSNYAVDTTRPASHKLQISGTWWTTYALTPGSKLQRVRVYDQALSDAQLSSLRANSSNYCPW